MGKRAAAVGIAANALMFVAKLIVGLFSSSGAVLADSVNSLSDSVTGIVNYFGFYMSGKPADRDHPFGHGRIEYISSLIISGAVILAGYEFLMYSIKRIIEPKAVIFETFMAFVLSASVIIKIMMFLYYRKTSLRINSESFRGASMDSLSDSVITLTTLIGLVFSAKTGILIDGYIGVLVSVLVIVSGFSSAMSSVSYILGKKADPVLVEEMSAIISKNSSIMGVHDVMVHDYGPGRQIASAHIEVSAEMSLQNAHSIADRTEIEVRDVLGIPITIHVDPIVSLERKDADDHVSGSKQKRHFRGKLKGDKDQNSGRIEEKSE